MIAALLLTDVFGPTDLLATLGIGALLCTALATGAAVARRSRSARPVW